MLTTDYAPGTLIESAGETFRYIGEFYAYFIKRNVYMYDPIKTEVCYTPFNGEENWHTINNIPVTAIPLNRKIYAEIITEEEATCK